MTPDRATDHESVRRMLEPRSVAIVGASPRAGSFGERMVSEVLRSSADLAVHLINPRYDEIAGRPCVGSLADLDEPVDLVLLGVGDGALEEQLHLAATQSAASAVVFGNAYEPPVDGAPSLRERLAAVAREAGIALCGGGCMGFINVVRGVRAIGYVEPDPIPAGPLALITHSGSVFSAMLRTRRGLGYSIAVSSGQELVTSTPAYLSYALSLPETKVVAMVLETVRDAPVLREQLVVAAERDVPVVVLPVGTSERGRSMVAAHSGAVAGGAAAWEALADAHGMHLVSDLGELADTVEIFAAGRRARPRGAGSSQAGVAAVLDSGAERALLVDVATACGVPFAEISPATISALSARLDPGLAATNPLDVWGNGADTEGLFGDVLVTLAGDPSVQAVALAVDLVEELDGDDSYRDALLRAAAATDLPIVVVSHLPSALDLTAAARLRAAGVPVLEGTSSGLRALGHLLDHADRPPAVVTAPIDADRQAFWQSRLGDRSSVRPAELFRLFSAYGIPVAPVGAADHEGAVLEVADRIGYPVVLKTAEDIAHKTDVGGVVVGLGNEAELTAAYRKVAARLGRNVLVCRQVAPGVELLLGAVRDANLGLVMVVGAGGELVELIGDRAAALPPVDAARARRLLARTAADRLLRDRRGQSPADVDAVADTIARLSDLLAELGEEIAAIEINPLICNENGAVAVDVHLEFGNRTP